MQTAYERENSATKLLRAASPTLSLTALVMLADFVVCLVAMAIDSAAYYGNQCLVQAGELLEYPARSPA